MMAPEQFNEIMDLEDVLDFLQLNKGTFSHKVRAGEFPEGIRWTGRRCIWFKEDIIKSMNSLRKEKISKMNKKREELKKPCK